MISECHLNPHPIDSRVTYSVFLMQRRTDLWGPDGILYAFVVTVKSQTLY